MTELEEDGVYACGTVRKDRKGFPEHLKHSASSSPMPSALPLLEP